MRYINKSSQTQGPYCLKKKFDLSIPINPTNTWESLGRSGCKKEITNDLYPEQYNLCAYTEIDLDELGSCFKPPNLLKK